MKFNSLKVAFVLVACFIFGISAQAQRGKMTPEKFNAHMERMTKELELNKKQVKKVTKIEREFFDAMQTLRAEMPNRARVKRPASQTEDVRQKPARDPQAAERNKQRREKMRMLNNEHNNALKAVLTPAQFEKYSSAKEKRNDRMRDRVRAAKSNKGKVPAKSGKESLKKQKSSELKVNEGLKKEQ